MNYRPREVINSTVFDLTEFFPRLLDIAQSIEDSCEDFVIEKVDKLNARYTTNTLMFVPDDHDKIKKYHMSHHSLSQLCSKLGIPYSYIVKCHEDGNPELAEENINSWMQDYGKSFLIRTCESGVRGILSTRYTPLDTLEILKVLQEVLDFSEFNIVGYMLTPERFHLRIAQKKEFMSNEDLFAGVQIDSSDVGKSKLTVNFLIYKQVCKNGLVAQKSGGVLFEQRHVGVDPEDFKSKLKESLTQIPHLIDKFIHFKEQVVPQIEGYDVVNYDDEELKLFKERTKHHTKLADEHVDMLVTLMLENYTSDYWGYMNALTELAQQFTFEKRITLEKIAGSLLQLA